MGRNFTCCATPATSLPGSSRKWWDACFGASSIRSSTRRLSHKCLSVKLSRNSLGLLTTRPEPQSTILERGKQCALFNANVSEVRLAVAESISKPKLRAFPKGDLESTLLSATQHITLVNHVGIEFGMPQKCEHRWRSKTCSSSRLSMACRQQSVCPLNLRLQEPMT